MNIIFLVALCIGLAASSTLNQAKSISVTIYNNNFAMVKDVRSISFDEGSSFLYFTDVSSNIQTETVTFKPLDSKSQIRVYEQNFESNLVNKYSILKKYIEKDIKLYVKLGDTSKLVKGKLLGYDDGYILQTDHGIDVFNNIDSIQFPSLPDGFFTVPTLNWKVWSKQKVTTDCEVAYRTTGFGWKADYSITLNEDEKIADIGGWVTIDNNSGKKYVNAKLKLIAGDVNTVAQTPLPIIYYAKTVNAPPAPAPSAPAFSQKSFADYHLYTLDQPVHLNQSSQKQVQFIPKVYNVTVRKYHLITINAGGFSSLNIKAQNKVQFKNTKQLGLGIPFPKGTVRVFKTDKDDGSLQFVGQDSINHTPKDQNITISTGSAFDIVTNVNSESRQGFKNGGYTAKMNITITNHKDTPVEIEVQLNQYYGDNLSIKWKTQSNLLQKQSSNLYKLNIQSLGPNQTFTANWQENYYP